jgi:mono/diheme cytochrome c family protein
MPQIIIKQRMLVATSVLLMSLAAFSVHGQEAKQLYEQTCATCHGADGKGDGPTGQMLQPKPADFTIVLKDKDAAYLSKVIREGGPSVGKSPLMPSFQEILSDKQIQDLIQYVKAFVSS